MTKSRLLLDAEADAAVSDLRIFSVGAWDVVEPNTPLRWNWHHRAVSEHLEAVKAGQITRLIINMPPRNMKSLLASVFFPTWWWVDDPYARFIFTSYAQSLATKHSVGRRQVIESPWYQERWADRFSLSADQNLKTEFANNKRGEMIATSMHGTATGKGADCIVIDDPHDTTRAASQTMRERDIEAFDQKFSTRLNDKKTGRIVLIMQRLHTKDMTGHLLAQGGWAHLKLAAEAPTKQTISFPMTKKVKHREPGDVLDPVREPKEVLEMQKRSLGSWGYAGQYDQEPTDRAGGIVKRQWLKFYKVLPTMMNVRALSWDMSFKDTQTSDYVVGQAWAKKNGDYYLIDQVRDRMDFVGALAAFKAFAGKHSNFYAKLVEDKANGPAIISMLKRDIPGIIEFEPGLYGSKEARLSAVSPFFESGNVWLPDPSIAPWVNDYIEELVTFPNAANDDQVDPTSQFLLTYGETGGYSLQKIIKK